MARIEGQVVIRAPRDRVFEVLSNGDRAAEWSLSVAEAHHETPLPIRLGTRLSVHAHAGKRSYRWTQEVVGWDPPRSFRDRMVPGTGPFRAFEDWGVFEEVPGGTQFTFGVEYSLPYGPLGALVDRLRIAPRVRRDQAASLERAKRLLEGAHLSS